MKKYMRMALVLFLGIFLAGEAKVYAQDMKMSPKTIYINQKVQLSAGSRANLKDVRWKSSNSKIAPVSKKGIVTGKKTGKVKIAVTSKKNSKVRAVWHITVKKFTSKKITCKKSKIITGSNVFRDVYKKDLKYKVFRSYESLQKFIKSAKEKEGDFFDPALKKKLNSYKKSYFKKKSLCIFIVTAGSGGQKIKMKDLRSVQDKSGRIVGRLNLQYNKQKPGEEWPDNVSYHTIFLELNQKDAEMIQHYQAVKVK